jgi:hypothetical protein
VGLREKLEVLFKAATGDGAARYLLAERVARGLHPEAILSDRGKNWLHDTEFVGIYDRFHDGRFHLTMDRVYLLDQLAHLSAGIPGATAECGAYQGLTSYMICRRTQPGKSHHVFDSFQGLSTPLPVDGEHWAKGDMVATEQQFRQNLVGFDVEVHAGWIPDRFDEVANTTFCFVHVDVDLYEPTRDSVSFFYERMSPGGVLVFDDYGFSNCPGATRAVDEFMSDKREPVVMAPTGQGLVFVGLGNLA